jgi:hypothetical protein
MSEANDATTAGKGCERRISAEQSGEERTRLDPPSADSYTRGIGNHVVLPELADLAEIYTPERKAEFLLNNSITKEDYDEACRSIREDFGLDPKTIPFTDPNMRDGLMTNAEFDELVERSRLRAEDRQKDG